MTRIADSSVSIQTSSESVPCPPPWFGEIAVTAHSLRHVDVLATIEERVRFARRRFGHYDLIDFAVVLLGYAISGECRLPAFYERVQPFAVPFMALFGRERLPHRSTLSRFLAALDQALWDTRYLCHVSRSSQRLSRIQLRPCAHLFSAVFHSSSSSISLLLLCTSRESRLIVSGQRDKASSSGTTGHLFCPP